MVLDAGDDVTLLCEASCWSPQPEITFVDAQGQNISAEDPQIDEDSRTRCFTATRRATVRTASRFSFSLMLRFMLQFQLLPFASRKLYMC